MLLNIKTVLFAFGILYFRETLCYPPPSSPVAIFMQNLEHLSQQLEDSRIPLEHRRLFFRPLIKNIQDKTRVLLSKFSGAPASTGPTRFTGYTGFSGYTGYIGSTAATDRPMNNTQGAATSRNTPIPSMADPSPEVARHLNSQSNFVSDVDADSEDRQIQEEPITVDPTNSYNRTDSLKPDDEDDELTIRILPQPVVATLLG